MSDYTITDISVKAYRVDRLVGWLVSVVYFVDISRGWHSQNVKKKQGKRVVCVHVTATWYKKATLISRELHCSCAEVACLSSLVSNVFK